MAKKNIIAIEVAFEGAYTRTREDNIIVSEAAFSTIAWNVEASEGKLTMTQDDNNENLYTLSNGEETKTLMVEKQVHQKVDKTWKIDGKKMADGTTIKLNGTFKGDYEVWSNHTIRDNGKRTWKRLSITKSEDEGRKNLKKAIKEYQTTLKPEVEAKAQ